MPFINLWSVVGVLMIAIFLSVLVWALGHLPTGFILILIVLFIGAVIAANAGDS
jgi:membrane protease YdiL (CAAX protease family)